MGLALEGVGQIVVCRDSDEAMRALEDEPAQLMIWGGSPAELLSGNRLERLRQERRILDCVLLVDAEAAAVAEGAMDQGVADTWVRPVLMAPLRHRTQALLGQRRLVHEFRRLRDRLQTIEQTRVLAPFVDAEKVYPAVLDLLLRAGSRSRGFAFFVRREVPAGFDVVFRGLSEPAANFLRQRLVEQKPLDLDVYARIEILDRGEIHTALRGAGVDAETVLVVPVKGNEAEAGIACVFSDDRVIADHEIGQAELIADRACEALRNAERYQHAKERAFVDDVTEAYNARYFLSVLDQEIRRADRYGTSFSMLFLDLDRFKQINDSYGHLVGSEILHRVSRLLLQCIRQVDTLARYGGDEFTILLSDTESGEAMLVAERIRRSVEEFVFEMRQGAPLRLTVSTGVASFPRDGASREALLDIADKAMYRAKSMGRNCVCSATDLHAVRAEGD